MENTTNNNQWLIEIGDSDEYWAKYLENVPNMICISYKHLRTLARDGKVYGTMLQCKDIFELVCKTPLIMVLISLEANQRYKDTEVFQDILKICLDSPMSMGSWDSLAGIIVKKNKDLHLPENIYQILKRTRKLYQEKISDSASNVVNWRNNTIGHGVLRFENDDSYKKELTCLLKLLKEYFDGQKKYSIKGLYDNLYFFLGENRLTGEYWSDEVNEGNVQLAFNGIKTDTSNYIVNQNYKCYLFDAFYKSKRIVKYSSYIDGHSIIATNSYFSELANRVKMTKTTQKDIKSVYIKREEEKVLEYLNAPIDYVEPKWLIEALEKKMEDLGKGTIIIFMERGTGKSAFANQMNGLYHSSSLIPDAFSRSYHIQNAVLRGLSDFVNSINFGYRHSNNADADLYGSEKELPSISLKDENLQQSLAHFLNTYHCIYQRDYTILLLDGIDELTPDISDIINFLPSRELLDDGIFIVLLSRFEDETTVLGQSKEYIKKARNIADGIIKLSRKSKFNEDVLVQYIKRTSPDIGMNDIEPLILKSDYRFLYLKAILSVSGDYSLDNTSETSFISSFMDYVNSFYGINQQTKIKEIAVAMALFSNISLNDYKQYIACQEITYEFVGLFNNLLPLMTVTHQDGVTCYAFADQAYNEYIINSYPEVVQTVVNRFYVSFSEYLGIYLSGDRYENFEKESTFNSSEMNKDIVFFSKSIVEIWEKVPRQCMIADTKIPEKHILRLYANLVTDEWAKFGMGAYLRDSLRDSICMHLYVALLTNTVTGDNVCAKWVDHIIGHIDPEDDYAETTEWFLYRMAAEDLMECDSLDKYLLDYVTDHVNDIKDIKKWYWVFVKKCSNRTANALASSSHVDDFVEYLLESAAPIYYEEWFNALLSYDISDEIKARMTNKLENPSYGEKLDYDYYFEILEAAITILEDYSTSIKDDMGDVDEDNHGPIYTIFKKIGEGDEISNLLGKENMNRLYAAFISRLKYEREKGTFEEFICELYYFYPSTLSIIYEQYYGEKWPEKALEIIPDMISIEKKGYIFATQVLVDLILKIASWLEKEKRFAEEIGILEKLIDGIDGRHFLTCHTTNSFHYEKLMNSNGWGIAERYYPSDNTLYFLKLLYRLGFRELIKTLMDALELSCTAVEQTIYMDEELAIAHELQKYRFMQMRERLGYHSDFDEQVKKIVSSHRIYVLDELDKVSSNSMFPQIHHETELLLDYAWQTKQWNLGIEECNMILDAISEIEIRDNPDVVVQSIAILKDKIRRCKSLFLFMNGINDNSNIENSKSELISTYDLPRYTLFWCISMVFENKNATDSKKMEKILEETEIKLRFY